MSDNARGVHVSPGVYSREVDLTYAVKSLGITTLGLVGETQKGPAFQPMSIGNWRDFVSTFGGTNPEKFKGSQYPKYELPYIAKSYLTQSNQLEVVRVLGLSGYNAGPAWLVTADMIGDADLNVEGKQNKMVVAVLRARGDYYKYRKFDPSTGTCACPNEAYDTLVYEVGETTKDASQCDSPIQYNKYALELGEYSPLYSSGNDCEGYEFSKEKQGFAISATNYGRFKIKGIKGVHSIGTSYDNLKNSHEFSGDCFEYAVSLNPFDKDYILKVLGSSPSDGDAPIYVESLYDVSLAKAIANNNDQHAIQLSRDLTFYQVFYPTDFDGLEPIAGLMTIQESNLSRRNIAQRYLADYDAATSDQYANDPALTFHLYDYNTGLPVKDNEVDNEDVAIFGQHTADKNGFAVFKVKAGFIYTVVQYTDANGKRHYYYRAYSRHSINEYAKSKNKFTWLDQTTKKEVSATTVADVLTKLNITHKDGVSVYKNEIYNTKEEALTSLGNDIHRAQSIPNNAAAFRGIVYASHNKAIDAADASVSVSGSGYSFLSADTNGSETLVYSEDAKTAYEYVESLVKDVTEGYVYFNSTAIYASVDDAKKILSGNVITTKSTYVDANSKEIANTIAGVFGTYGVNSNQIDTVPLFDNLVDGGDATVHLSSEAASVTGNVPSSMVTRQITNTPRQVCVKNLSDGLYYRLVSKNGKEDVAFVSCNLNDYKSAYRYSSTPWIVSNLMGDYEKIELKKLFRFHTISDGKDSSKEVKISIENIRPDDGMFDVVVRDINDTDEYQVPLEKFSHCNLVPGTHNYIAFKIGSYDGMYESKSKYITVECKDGDVVESAIPAGFLGYPSVQFDGVPVVNEQETTIANPLLTYNRVYDEDVKNRKQYFGLSTRVGVDLDMFTFKGNAAYISNPSVLTNGFHLDSRLNMSGYLSSDKPKVTVDGQSGYKFDAVSQNSRTSLLTGAPIIGTEEAMTGTIYEYVNLRKFTVYFYGGFDGWDEFRTSRTNTDEFKASKYLGSYDNNSGEGYSFNRISDPETLGLNQNGITSDWYAYLAGIRQFSNPEAVDINVFATPGIDYVNNKTLVEETIEMLEEERADSIYVVTTPDKPMGAGDFVDEMFTPDDAVYNLEDSEINSNYTCTYYPWVKYFDQDNSQYVYLPATKDVVRNFAQTDNTTYPWFAPAGLERGEVNCVRAHLTTKNADEDVLYEGRINPVKTFATDGVKIWGQKNLQVKDSQLNRIAVRRLLLRMRKLIAIACRSLIFEPNDSVTKNSFLSAVTPILDNIRANRGLSDYKIEVNDTVESRDRRELPAKIYFKPYNALEYVVLDFILTPEGVSFDNI